MGFPVRQIVGGQQAEVALAGHVHHRRGMEIGVDRLGDPAAVPDVAGPVDHRLARPASGLCLLHDAGVGLTHRRIGEQAARRRRLAVLQVNRRGSRPFGLEQFLHGVDRRRDAPDRRIAVDRIVDRRLQNLGEAHGAVVPQHPQPAVEGARDDGGQEPAARNEIEPEAADRFHRHRRRARPLGAERLQLAGLLAVEQGRKVAARAVQVRLDHLQGETAGDRGVEGVAAPLQGPHSGRRPEPMGGSNNSECAADFRARRKHGADSWNSFRMGSVDTIEARAFARQELPGGAPRARTAA